MSSQRSKKNKLYWGTEESYFPFKISIRSVSDEDIEWSKKLTPTQRVEWLLMMQKLLLEHYRELKK